MASLDVSAASRADQRPRSAREDDRVARNHGAEITELKRQLSAAHELLRTTNNRRLATLAALKTAEAKLKETKEPKEKPRRAKVMSAGKLDGDAAEIVQHWIASFQPDDIPKLALAILTKAQKQLKVDMVAGIKGCRARSSSAAEAVAAR